MLVHGRNDRRFSVPRSGQGWRSMASIGRDGHRKSAARPRRAVSRDPPLPRVGAPPLRARGPARSRHDPPTDRLAQPGLEPGEALALQAPELQTSRSLSSPPLVSAEGRNDTVSGRLALEAPQQSIDSGVGERPELVGLRTGERNAPIQGHARRPDRIDRAGLLGQDARGILHRLELAPGDPGRHLPSG
jgi:hypothetical protein